MMKKVMIVFLGLFFVIGILSAGGKSDTSKESGITTITVWHYWQEGSQREMLDYLTSNFHKDQSTVRVQPRYVAFDDFRKQLSIAAAAGELPDIAIFDGVDHASYTSMGIFADITGKIDTSRFFEAPVESATWNGRLYGVPFGINALTMYYNKDLFDKVGLKVPTTWDELRDTAKKLTTPTVNGILISAKPTEEGTFNFLPYVWSAGATAFDINNPAGIKALEFVASLVSDGSMSQEVVNMSMDDVKNQFIAGNTAMMVNGPWQVTGIRQSAPNLNWGVSLIPKDKEFAAGLGGENIGIIDNKNINASLAFVNYIIRPDFQATYFDTLGISANKDVAAKQFPNDQIRQGFVNQQQYAHPRGPHPRWPEISDAISLAFNQVITRQKTASEAAKIAQDTIDRIK